MRVLFVLVGCLSVVEAAAKTGQCKGAACSHCVEEVVDPNAKTCAAALRPARSPKHALKFCHIFPDKSCCLPAQDAEIEEHYFNLLDAGDICAKESSMAKDALKKIFCAACSPQQPDYIDETTNKFKICSSLAKRVNPTCFDDCGMVRVAERGALCAGDDVIVPSKYWVKCAANDSATFGADETAGQPVFGSDDGCVPFTGEADTTQCCDKETPEECEGIGEPYSCSGFWKFINDGTGAKPPFLDNDIEIVKCDPNDEDHDASITCSTLCYTGAGSRTAVQWVTLAAMMMVVAITSL